MQKNRKNEDFIELALDEILKNNGYYEKKDKTSLRYKVLANVKGDLVVVSKNENGHYLYFNPNDDRDRGNIFNFCKNRGIRAQDLLKGIEGVDLKATNITHTSISSKKALEEYEAMKGLAFNNFFFTKRLIDPHLMQEFVNLKQDKLKNIIVPSFTLSQTTLNEKIHSYIVPNGYVSYLCSPLIDKESKIPKNIKSLCYGTKGLEILKTQQSKKEDVENIIITESMIDSLSLLELKEFNPKNILLCSTNGQLSKAQKEVFMYLNDNFKEAKVYLGFDNDSKGKEFEKSAKEFFHKATCLKPNFKDFNDDLIVAKHFNLENNFIKTDCQKLFFEMEKRAVLFVKNFHKMSHEEMAKELKQISTIDLPKYEKIKPKIEKYLETKTLDFSYNKLSQCLERELGKARVV
ncbi:toprim domain-containing protein [Campylobacter upsaliensis]|uniref:toprim domain-containing protein n=1 Tax=Campylobacter upsaliensis TaxID=28080 RepID=UPI0012705E86|nr:toprim domain-containing protein [Campylobacter upsaliensis]EAI1980785.1 toprim domain-containing protein [Campylobacter upsaliensis]EAI5398507.1 toprim domain-containing protein [Campylobacter upsaliensis]EAI6697225.1 toprim domain-containing protein [Campylobacter upsaliensis]EAI8782901.1 toprim domain-containing protein [Campylobacter upsaliensis]EAJ4636163.1 toprim domain-containing protein [Campylobacter upsaliensis]